MKNYAKKNFLELIRKIFKLREVIDLLCPSKKLRLKANTKPWMDSEIVPAICRKINNFD